MLHPLVVEALGEVASEVRPPALFARQGSGQDGLAEDQEILCFEGRHELGIVFLRAVLDADALVALLELVQRRQAGLEQALLAEDAAVLRHVLLGLAADLAHLLGAVAIHQGLESRLGRGHGIGGDRCLGGRSPGIR